MICMRKELAFEILAEVEVVMVEVYASCWQCAHAG